VYIRGGLAVDLRPDMPSKLTKRVVEALEPRQRPFEERDTELHGFLVRVERGGTKSFFLDYRLAGGRKGRRQRYRLGAYPGLSVDGARELAKVAAGDVARGIDLQARKSAARDREARERYSTLRGFLDGQYEPWARTHLKSVDFQLARLRSDFADYLDRALSTFNLFMIEGLRQRWKKDGMKSRSVNRDVQRLQSVLSRAVEWGVLERHPLAGLKPLKTDKTARVRFLSTDEESALRQALETRESRLRDARARFNAWRIARHKKPLPEKQGDLLDHVRPLVIVALNTGLRRGELLGLKWGGVNLSAKLLTVTAVTAKSGHTRPVPLNSEALEMLTTWYERKGKPPPSAFVFPNAEGERIKSIATAWRSLVKAAGVKNFRLHDCRHHFASKLVQAGVDLYTVKELLGHSEIAMTEKYSHLAPGNLRQAVERIVA
jgi:site-specific recombinase XerD